MKKTIAILLSTALLASLLAVCAISVSAKTWEDNQVIDDAGDYIFDNAYGFVFNINYVDGSIAGEDVTLITNSAAYVTANPNWAISVFLTATEAEGVYAVQSVVPTPAAVEGWDINAIWPADADLCLIAHSAYSNPNGTGYQSKCAAMALTAGELILIDGDKAIVQNEDGTLPEAGGSDDESEAPSVEVVLKNFAEGASYTTSLLYRQGGKEVEWGWDENAAVAYPDEDGKSLTDGVLAANDADYTDAAFAGFHAKAPDYVENGYAWITVDLGEVKSISNVSMNVGTSKNANLAAVGIASPHSVQYFVSDDGENWTALGDAIVPADGPEGTEDIALELAEAVDAQYVQARFTSEGWMFISEIEVEGYVEVDSGETTPDAGDASNMIVFAVIALVALAGTAVVVKTRR